MSFIRKFGDFRNRKVVSITENINAGKKLLKEISLVTRIAKKHNLIDKDLENKIKDGKNYLYFNDFDGANLNTIKKEIRNIKLDAREIKEIESNQEFADIKKLLAKNLGWVYNFAYFYFVEQMPLEDLGETYKKLLKHKDLLNQMPKKFDQGFIDTSINNNIEVLDDQLTTLDNHAKVKRFLKHTTPEIRADYKKRASALDKEKFDGIATRLDDIVSSGDKVLISILDGFWAKIRRYTTVKEVIKEAVHKLKALDNADFRKFREAIDLANKRFGNFGVDIVFEENGILVLDVKSYQANKLINGHTAHCIAERESYWNSYVEETNNKQYYIYNFNAPSESFDGQSDNRSVIGVTIDQERGGEKIYRHPSHGLACHDKDDGRFDQKLKPQLKEWEKEYGIETDIFKDVLKPMSKEQLHLREGKRDADRNIVNQNLSIEDISRYVKLGADINKNQGAALKNAVSEDDKEKVKFILELGASPDAGGDNNSISSHAKDMEMIKILVDAGATPSGSLLTKPFIISNLDNFKFLIRAGADPSYNNSYIIKAAMSRKIVIDGESVTLPEEVLKIAIDGVDMENLNFRKNMMPRIMDSGRYDVLDIFLDKGYDGLTELDIEFLYGPDSLVGDADLIDNDVTDESPEDIEAGFERVLRKHKLI